MGEDTERVGGQRRATASDLHEAQGAPVALKRLRQLIDDTLADLEDLERRLNRPQAAGAGVASDRQRPVADGVQVKMLQTTLAEKQRKLALVEEDLSYLTGRFSQKLREISDLENERERLNGIILAERKRTLTERKIVARRDKYIDEIRSTLYWRLRSLLKLIANRVYGLRAAPHNPLFRAAFYLDEYPDVRASGMDPYAHFLNYGIVEGRNPHPLFDTDWYLDQNPDVLRACTDPLLHYYKFGAAEGRDPNPWFDTDWYLESNPDVRAAGVNPFVHYVNHGASEGRDPHPEVSIARYLERYPHLRGQGIGVLKHYMNNVKRRPQ